MMRKFKGARLAAVILLVASVFGCASAVQKSEAKKSPEEIANAWVNIARTSLTDGDAIGALQALEKAEEYDKSNVEIPLLRALSFTAKRDPASALVHIEKAYAMAPRDPRIATTYGKLLLDSGRMSDAMAPLSFAANLATYREAYKARTSLGIIHYRRGDIATAQREFQRATEDAPADACIAYYYLGHIRLKQSKFNDAATYYDKATQRLCASFTDAHLAVALAYQRAGRIDQARKKYLEIRQNFPQSPAATVAMKKLTELP